MAFEAATMLPFPNINRSKISSLVCSDDDSMSAMKATIGVSFST